MPNKWKAFISSAEASACFNQPFDWFSLPGHWWEMMRIIKWLNLSLPSLLSWIPNSFYSVIVNTEHFLPEITFNIVRLGPVQLSLTPLLRKLTLAQDSDSQTLVSSGLMGHLTFSTLKKYAVQWGLILHCVVNFSPPGRVEDWLRSKSVKEIYILYPSNAFNEITKQWSAVNG